MRGCSIVCPVRLKRTKEERIPGMSYILYVVGFMIVIGGLIYGAALLHVPAQWIVVCSVILLGIAILTGVKATRQKDQSK
jgi:uncharacterized membrane protein